AQWPVAAAPLGAGDLGLRGHPHLDLAKVRRSADNERAVRRVAKHLECPRPVRVIAEDGDGCRFAPVGLGPEPDRYLGCGTWCHCQREDIYVRDEGLVRP